MSRRLATIGLGLAVAAIWGAVAVRFSAGVADAPPPADPPRPLEATSQAHGLPPSYVASLRDPFRPPFEVSAHPRQRASLAFVGAPAPQEPYPASAPEAPSHQDRFTETEVPQPPPLPALDLFGVVGETALVGTGDGTTHVLRPGDRFGDLLVLGVGSGEAVIRWHSRVDTLRITP